MRLYKPRDFLNAVSSPILAMGLGLVGGGILLASAGVNPVIGYYYLVEGALGNYYNIAETLVKMTPLLIIGLGMAIAFKCGIWNIGGEGQFLLGAIVTAWLGSSIQGLPPFLFILLLIVAGYGAGAFWAVIPAWLRANWEVNEIITTLMMNYIAIYFINYLVWGPLRDPASGEPQTAGMVIAATFPKLLSGTRLSTGIFISVLAIIAVYIILQKTTLGYQIKSVGANPKAAKYGGIKVSNIIIIAMILSGGLSGLAGMVDMAGVQQRFIRGFAPGYGYDSIAIALVAKNHPIGVILVSFFFAVLLVGGDMMYRATGVPVFLVRAIEGLILIFILMSEFLPKYIKFGRKKIIDSSY